MITVCRLHSIVVINHFLFPSYMISQFARFIFCCILPTGYTNANGPLFVLPPLLRTSLKIWHNFGKWKKKAFCTELKTSSSPNVGRLLIFLSIHYNRTKTKISSCTTPDEWNFLLIIPNLAFQNQVLT